MRTLIALTSMLIAAGAAVAEAPARYTQAASGNSLQFVFTQLDAANTGQFTRFSTTLVYDEKNPATGSLDVKVDVASLDTQDGERDGALLGADLLDAQRFPTATFKSAGFTRDAKGGLLARGRLTLRGVTRDITLPLALKASAGGLVLSGETSLRRLEFGVGQGEWKSTESVGDEVKIRYQVNLVRAR